MGIRATVSRKANFRRRKVRRRFARKVVPKAIKRYVRKAMTRSQEVKYTTYHYATTAIGNNATNGSVMYSVTVSQGTAYNQRIGDENLWTMLDFKGTFGIPGLTAAQGTMVRVMLLWLPNQQAYTTTTTLEAELFDNGVLSPFTTSPLFRDTSIKVLMDKLVGGNYGGGGSGQVIPFHFKKRIMKKTKYAAGSTNTESGRLVLYFVSNNATSTNCILAGSARFYFRE